MVSEAFIREFVHIEDASAIHKLSEIASVVSYKKREAVYTIGEKYRHFCILVKGAAYAYIYDEHQHPVVTCFFSEKYDFMNMEDFRHEAGIGLNALTEIEILQIPVDAAVLLAEEFPMLLWEYAKYFRKTMVYLCVINNRRMYLSADERYQWLCETWPMVLQKGSNKLVASFLRIRPESLSRLKSQMKQNEKADKPLSNILVTKDLQWDYRNIKEMMEQ